MTLTNIELMQQVKQNCLEQAEIVADCFNRALDFREKFTVSELMPWDADDSASELQESGIIVVLETGAGGVLVILPSSLPLPAWVHHPDESQASRMGTLGMEWSMSMMPEEFQGIGFSYHLVQNLFTACMRTGIADDAHLLKLELTNSEVPIFVLGPVIDVATIADPVAQAVESVSPSSASQQKAEAKNSQDLEIYERVQRIRRLIQLKVPVLVNLAEKKIQLKQLTSMSPGMLITFNKSCDDLLDLYVNNQLFCRGEAVKIGENFGIKINEVGSQVTEESGILTI